jgi:AcrR family transcriptional regulator
MTVRDELRELTHQRLLAAAEAVFGRDGYLRATVGNISREANVNRATFYLHFSDKADVLLAVLQTNLADTPEYWHDVDAALVDGGRDALRAALSRTLDWYEQHRGLLRYVREALATDPHLAQQTEGTFARFADEMSRYLAIVPADERDRAHLRLELLIIQLDQVALRLIVQRRQSFERERMLDELTDIWLLVLPAARRS